MSESSDLNIRIDTDIKEQAEHLFSQFGITITDAVNIFFHQSLNYGGIPFELKIDKSKAITSTAMKEDHWIAKGGHSFNGFDSSHYRKLYELLSTLQPQDKAQVDIVNIDQADSSDMQAIPINRNDTQVKNENPLNDPENFNLITFFERSKAERIIYEYLLESLSPHYIVIPHVSLVDIFSYSKPADDEEKYNIYKMLGYHVDFAIFDKLFHPVMAIEINGGHHLTNPKTIRSDYLKKELFIHFDVPLLSLDLSSSHPDHELGQLLRDTIEATPRIAYCWKCHLPIMSPFSECPVCHKTNITAPPLFADLSNE